VLVNDDGTSGLRVLLNMLLPAATPVFLRFSNQ
jgi:hypothetical protein